jgi:hypothetical protein
LPVGFTMPSAANATELAAQRTVAAMTNDFIVVPFLEKSCFNQKTLGSGVWG